MSGIPQGPGAPQVPGGGGDTARQAQEAQQRAQAAGGASPGSAASQAPGGADEFQQRLASEQQRAAAQQQATRGQTQPQQAPGQQEQQESQQQATTQQEDTSTGPVGQGDYVVRDGDCISSIALDRGHFWETIWDDSANSGLREVRQDPNVILPGDRLTILEIRPKVVSKETEMRHRFVRRGEPARMRLRVLQENDEPRANQPYTLEIDGETHEGTTDPNGQLEVPIPATAQRGTLTIGPDNVEFKLALGRVDPITELSGVQGRLNNLGYNVGATDGQLGPKTRAALKYFQRRNKLEPTGRPDEATKNKLREQHGS